MTRIKQEIVTKISDGRYMLKNRKGKYYTAELSKYCKEPVIEGLDAEVVFKYNPMGKKTPYIIGVVLNE